MTQEKSEENGGSLMYVYAVSFVAAIGGLLFGFDTGVISGTIQFVTAHFELNTVQEGFAVSNLLIGCIIGASFTGMISDRIGRKKVLIATALLFIVSAVFSALPRTFIELIAARFVGGIAVGGASVLSPVYIAEISPARIRGRLVSFNQLAIVTGILLSYFSNWLLVDTGDNNWRWMFAAEAVPAALFLSVLFSVPESPRWLIKRGMQDTAAAVLKKIGGAIHARTEMQEIKTAMQKEKGSIKELLHPGLRLALITGILLAIFQQITGINTVIYYAPKIFMKAGYESASSALLSSVIVGFTNMICTVIAISYVDRFGRKPLLLFGLAGMGLSFVFAGFAMHQGELAAGLILVPIIAYVAFFAMSLGPVVWVLLSEIFPTEIRGTAMSIATMVLWISCFAVAQTFPWLVEKFAESTFYMFSVICLAAFIFVFYMVRETKGKSLEEIEKMWGIIGDSKK